MKTEPQRPHRQRYVLLDAMRGVAAIAVVWGHLMDSWSRPDLSGPQYILAVDFFFILSGFVIGHAYGRQMKAGMSPVDFGIVRAVRLYPLLILGAVIGTIVLLARASNDAGYGPVAILESGVFAALGLPGIFIATTTLAFPINGPAWSLFFELGANFVYGFIARFLTINRLIAITAIGATALIFFALRNNTIEMGWQKGMVEEGATRVIFGFFAGLLIHELRPQREAPAWLGHVLLAGLAICLLEPLRANVQVQLALAIIVFPALVWMGSAVRATPWVARFGAVLGGLSYPLYILHWPFVDLTRDLFLSIDPTAQWMGVWVVLQIAIVVTVAVLAMKLFGEPVRARLMRLVRAKRQRDELAKAHAPSA